MDILAMVSSFRLGGHRNVFVSFPFAPRKTLFPFRAVDVSPAQSEGHQKEKERQEKNNEDVVKSLFSQQRALRAFFSYGFIFSLVWGLLVLV